MNNLRFLIIILALIIGLSFIYESSKLFEYESDIPTYKFDISAFFNDRPIDFQYNYPLNNFLFYYDFTSNEGNVSFFLNFENFSFNNFELIFPKIVDKKNVAVEIQACDRSGLNCSKDLLYPTEYLDKNFSIIPGYFGESNRTQLKVSNFTVPLENNKINVVFKSDLKPSAVFDLLHVYNKINYRFYGMEFKLTRKYQCLGRCVVDIDGAIREYRTSSVADLKIELLENGTKPQHRVKLETINRDILFWKDFDLAFGVAIFSASLILLIELMFPSKNLKKIFINKRCLVSKPKKKQ